MARSSLAFLGAAVLGASPAAATDKAMPDTATPQGPMPQAASPQIATPPTATPQIGKPSIAKPRSTKPQPDAAAPGAVDDAATYRAALLVEAPDLPSKVRTFIGRVAWSSRKLGDSGGLAAEATIDIPTDKIKAVVTFAKNTDSTLPAAETIAVRFTIEPGSSTGNVSRISVPQMRVEDEPVGQPLAGIAVPVTQNSFLVGLRMGSGEAPNLAILKVQQWVDIPMLLADGKIAKLTFEKGGAGQNALDEASASWKKP